MNENQKAESVKLREEIKDIKISTFEYLKSITRMDTTQLGHCGYKTKEQAFLDIMERRTREIERKIVAFEKKYPN